MSNYEVQNVRSAANGHWREVLVRAGIEASYLTGKAGPCPFCRAGTDRWVFDNKNGNGNGFCRQCDAKGDGFRLVGKAMGLNSKRDFPKILEFVANSIGLKVSSGASKQSTTKTGSSYDFISIWDQSKPLKESAPGIVESYLRNRGIELDYVPECLRFHSSLGAFDKDRSLGDHPAMVAAVTDEIGNIIGLHRTYLTPEGTKAPLGKSTKKVLGSISGGTIRLYEGSVRTVGIAEGIENSLSVHRATGMDMVAAPSGTVMKNTPFLSTVEEIHIWADLDRSGAGKKFAEELANRLVAEGKKVFIHFPPFEIPENEKGIDWNTILQKNGPEEILRARLECTEWKPPKSLSDWPIRLPLPPKLSPIAKLRSDMLPAALRPWIEDLSERMNLPLEFVAGCAITVMGSAIGRRCGIHPHQEDDWLVIPCLWGGLVAPPSVLKTPAMSAAISPLRKLEADTQKQFGEALKKHNDRVELEKISIDARSTELKKKARGGLEKAKIEEELKIIQQTVGELDEGAPWLRRYSTNDATTEKLGELLSKNPDGMFVFRDELYGFLKSLEKQGRENDRAFYLESWNGLGSYTFDRIGRGTIHVPALCISMFGGIQPDRLHAYFSQVISNGSGDDGFLSRFQILFYPDSPTKFKYVDRKPNYEAKRRVNNIVARLVETNYRQLGIKIDEFRDIPTFRFDSKAQQIFREWYERFSQNLLDSTEPSSIVSHLGKYRSLVPALSLIFHLVDNCEAEFVPLEVSADSISMALTWIEILEQHARRIYSQSINPDIHAAYALDKKIRAGRLTDGTTVREIYRNEWSDLTKPEFVKGGLALLEKLGWLRVEEVRGSAGGAPSELIRLHPELVASTERPDTTNPSEGAE